MTLEEIMEWLETLQAEATDHPNGLTMRSTGTEFWNNKLVGKWLSEIKVLSITGAAPSALEKLAIHYILGCYPAGGNTGRKRESDERRQIQDL